MLDDATLDRLAEAAWDLRCQRMAEAEDGPKFLPGTWAGRAEHLKETDRSVVSLVAAQVLADHGIAPLLEEVTRLRMQRAALRDLIVSKGNRVSAEDMLRLLDADETAGKLADADNTIGQIIRLAEAWKMQDGILDGNYVAEVLLETCRPWTGEERSDEKEK